MAMAIVSRHHLIIVNNCGVGTDRRRCRRRAGGVGERLSGSEYTPNAASRRAAPHAASFIHLQQTAHIVSHNTVRVVSATGRGRCPARLNLIRQTVSKIEETGLSMNSIIVMNLYWITRCTSLVSVVPQSKLVSGWGLRKRRSAPPSGLQSSRRTLLYCWGWNDSYCCIRTTCRGISHRWVISLVVHSYRLSAIPRSGWGGEGRQWTRAGLLWCSKCDAMLTGPPVSTSTVTERWLYNHLTLYTSLE